MNFNTRLFFVINKLIGRSPWLDAFGRAGAEWVITGMLAWYMGSAFIGYFPAWRGAFWPLLFFGASWALGWIINIGLGALAREPRPHIKFPESKLLFTPLMSWKSFPSDHAMTAWLIFFLAIIFRLPFAWSLLPLALWVSWGRVFAGVHYPFDVLGGAAVAGGAAVLSYYCILFIS